MSKAKKASAPIGAKTSWKNAFKRDWQLYLMLLFPLAMVIIFNYASYPGLRMIFMDYKPAKGYSGSEWVGMKTILKVFKDADFHRALKSSIAFNLLDLVVGFPMPIILALMLNELRYPRFKKVTQTILYLPHFLSWVIVGSVAYTMFRPTTGLVNIALMNWGVISEGIPFLTEKWHWAVTYLLIGVWQGMGWGTIIYLADCHIFLLCHDSTPPITIRLRQVSSAAYSKAIFYSFLRALIGFIYKPVIPEYTLFILLIH